MQHSSGFRHPIKIAKSSKSLTQWLVQNNDNFSSFHCGPTHEINNNNNNNKIINVFRPGHNFLCVSFKQKCSCSFFFLRVQKGRCRDHSINPRKEHRTFEELLGYFHLLSQITKMSTGVAEQVEMFSGNLVLPLLSHPHWHLTPRGQLLLWYSPNLGR